MADEVLLPSGDDAGPAVAADEIASRFHQRVKITLGADGTNDGDVATGNPMPVSDAGGSLTVDGTGIGIEDKAAGTSTQGRVTVTTTSGTLLAANASRKYVTFINYGAVAVHLEFDGGDALTSDVYMQPTSSLDYYGTTIVTAITPSSTADVGYIEVAY